MDIAASPVRDRLLKFESPSAGKEAKPGLNSGDTECPSPDSPIQELEEDTLLDNFEKYFCLTYDSEVPVSTTLCVSRCLAEEYEGPEDSAPREEERKEDYLFEFRQARRRDYSLEDDAEDCLSYKFKQPSEQDSSKALTPDSRNKL